MQFMHYHHQHVSVAPDQHTSRYIHTTGRYAAEHVLQDRGASQLVGRTKFVGADDTIILEDESARMKLRGEGLPVGQLVTGVVMAVKGVAAPGGDFQVNVCSACSLGYWDQ